MINIKKIRKILNIGIINTIRMNYKYFGISGVKRLYIIASRNLNIVDLKGEIEVKRGHLSFACIKIGFQCASVCDCKYERSIWQNTGKIIIEDRVFWGSGFRLSNSGEVSFGSNFCNTANCTIICKKRIIFGNHNLVSWDVQIMDCDMHHIYEVSHPNRLINEDAEIKIGDNVWIGCRTTILKGTVIGNNNIIAACSLITRDEHMVENSILGCQNKIIKKEIFWKM